MSGEQVGRGDMGRGRDPCCTIHAGQTHPSGISRQSLACRRAAALIGWSDRSRRVALELATMVDGAGRWPLRPAFATRRFAAILLAALAGGVATSAMAADAAEGERLARQWCAACHIVADDQTTGSADVPTFREIAGRSDFDPNNLAAFLADPHPKMPDMSLTRREIDALVAYFESLR